MTTVSQFYLSNFTAEFKNGARPNQFYCDLVAPAALKGVIGNSTLAEQKLRFMCNATSLPASMIGQTNVPFRGRDFKIPGDRQFGDWDITIYNDTDFLPRNMFEEWSDWIDGNVNHDQYGNADAPVDIMASGNVHQLGKNGDILKTYLFVGIWPKVVSPIQLSYGANDQVESFNVTMAVQWWESDTTRNNTGASKFSNSGGSSLLAL
jgi:hypothetical protein